jgi:hypothetical protein
MTPAILALALSMTMPVTPVAQTMSRVPNFEITQQGHFLLNDDYGGDLAAYARAFELLASGGEEIWVKGQCLSACTMVLKNPKACAMPNAVFGFHAARYYNKDTFEIIGESDRGNRKMWAYYPDKVKQRLGGRLTAEPVYIKGTDLLPPCK